MKIIVFLFLTVIVFGNADDTFRHENRNFNSNAIIRQLFEMLKNIIKHGNSDKNVPVLDPFHFDYSDIEFSSPANVLRLQAGFANGVLIGFGDYQLLKTQFFREEIAAELCLNYPSTLFKSGHYEMQGDIYDSIPIAGMGKFELEMQNFTFCGKTFLMQSDDGKSILVKNITNPSFSIDQIESRIEFDGNIDDIVNAIINDVLASYLTRFNRFLAVNYIDKVIEKVNPFLNKFESWHILATLL